MRKNPHFFIGLLTVLFIAFSTNVDARILRVNNNLGITAIANLLYVDFATAQTAAVNGDTLQFEPSPNSYGALTLTKNLTLIGTGYFLGNNVGLQANNQSPVIGDINFNTGSAGSKVTGLTVYSFYVNAGLSNIVLERCLIQYRVYLYSSTNIIVRQNFFIYPYHCLQDNGNGVTNLLIQNNIFRGYVGLGTNVLGIFTQNTCHAYYGYNQGLGGLSGITNNIFHTYTATGSNIAAGSNNYFVAGAVQFGLNPAGTGATDINTFARTGGNADIDTYWLTLNASAVRTAGQGGIECGAFGGTFPYKLSGIPNVPSIYLFTAPTSASNTLNVNISTRSNN